MQVVEFSTKAIELLPTAPSAYLRRAQVYVGKQSFDLAIQDLNKSKILIYSDEIGEWDRPKLLLRILALKNALSKQQQKYEVRVMSWVLVITFITAEKESNGKKNE